MEPIAYDAKGNAYWLMGGEHSELKFLPPQTHILAGNRLWIQYAHPRKRAAKSHKRKQPATASTNGRKSTKRKQPPAASSSKVTATTSSTNTKSRASASNTTGRGSLRETRSRVQSAVSSAKSRALGTRVSSRLRGREEEELWQPIPEEWLTEGTKNNAEGEGQVNGKVEGNDTEAGEIALKSLDDLSELTSLSDLSELPEVEEEDKSEDGSEDCTPTPPSDFSSSSKEDIWETVGSSGHVRSPYLTRSVGLRHSGRLGEFSTAV